MKIIDIEAGSKALIIKVEDEDKKQYFYGLPQRPCDTPEQYYEDLAAEEEAKENEAEEEEEEKAVVEKISVDEKAINMIGIDSSKDCFTGGIIYELGVKEGGQRIDASKVQSFGCSSCATFLCLKSRGSEEEQKEPVSIEN